MFSGFLIKTQQLILLPLGLQQTIILETSVYLKIKNIFWSKLEENTSENLSEPAWNNECCETNSN